MWLTAGPDGCACAGSTVERTLRWSALGSAWVRRLGGGAIPGTEAMDGAAAPGSCGGAALCSVWKPGHIGVYIGNGYAVEAMGTTYGVVKTQVDGRGWSGWCKIPFINYLEVE